MLGLKAWATVRLTFSKWLSAVENHCHWCLRSIPSLNFCDSEIHIDIGSGKDFIAMLCMAALIWTNLGLGECLLNLGKDICNLRYKQNHNHRLFASRDVGTLKVLWRESGWIQPSCYILIKCQCAWWYFFPFSFLVKEAQISLFSTLMFSLPCVYSVHVAYQEIEVQQIPGLLPGTAIQNTAGNVGSGGKVKWWRQLSKSLCILPGEKAFRTFPISNHWEEQYARLWGFQEVENGNQAFLGSIWIRLGR